MSGIKTYIAIDLKSFYASVECHERGLNPLTTNLVVADLSRSSKTICLAVSPSLKAYGLKGRSRLFEVEQKVKEYKAKTGKKLEYITAPPQMALYIKYSSKIYGIYLKYFSAEDIHVYSIDEVFIDATSYLKLYNLSPEKLAQKVILDILNCTGITATAGIAPNLFLCKVAMDIVAKHINPDENGVRIAVLDEMTYRKNLWSHKPITDFWRIGPGLAERLRKNYMFTMGDIARRSLKNEDLLYKVFGVDAEILIDHAWGYEPCSIKDIKSYKSDQISFGSGQVLHRPYEYEKARIVVKEMAEILALDLFEKGMVTSSITLFVAYDKQFRDSKDSYKIELVTDPWGRVLPKPVQGTVGLGSLTYSSKIICDKVLYLFDVIVNKSLYVRKLNICANNVVTKEYKSMELFNDDIDETEESLQQTRLNIMKKYGKNAIIKGADLQEGATTIMRNNQIGGHRA